MLLMLNWLHSRSPSPQSFARGWLEILAGIRQYQRLDEPQRIDLRRRMQHFVAAKKWIAGGSLGQVAETMQVTIAAQACVMLLGFDEHYCFDGLRTIIVYPGAYSPLPSDGPREASVFESASPRVGEAWKRGPIVLAWDHVQAAARGRIPGQNVVVHEFAHHLDAMSYHPRGTQKAAPFAPLWSENMEAAFLSLLGQARRREVSWLDPYAATNRAEFFACASECFFETPAILRGHSAEVYDILRDYYRQDPFGWPGHGGARVQASRRRPPSVPKHDAWRGTLYYDAANDVGTAEPIKPAGDFSQLSGDAAFTLGIRYLSSGQSDSAEEAFSQAIARDPRDAEAYVMRARARSRRNDFAKALNDADTALGYEPDDLGALREKGAALLGMGQCAEACDYLRRTTDHPHAEAEAFFLYGVALLQSGAADKAARSLTASLSLAPLSAAALFHRGRAYQLLGKPTRAQQDLEKARQLDPIIEQRVTT